MPIPVAPEKKSRAFEQRNLKVPKSARYAIMGSLGAEQTEVWIAENPDHLIHYNGEKFLGPFTTTG